MMTARTKSGNLKGTCPACFRKVALQSQDGELRVARHGWCERGGRRAGSYGNAWHVGACFGVGYAPFEISAEGTIAYVSTVLYQRALGVENMLAKLATRPALVEEYVEQIFPRDGRLIQIDCPFEVRFVPGDVAVKGDFYAKPRVRALPSYEEVLRSRIVATEQEAESLRCEGRALCAKIDSWAPASIF